MSQENVEIARSLWEAWGRDGLDALFRFYDPDVVWDQSHYMTLELTGVYRGHDEVRGFLVAWIGSFDEFHASAGEFVDAGDAVVVSVRQGGRGTGSGVEVDMHLWQVLRMREGLVVEVTSYPTRAEAFEAVGLAGP